MYGSRKLKDIFIIGAKKSSFSIHRYLSNHPRLVKTEQPRIYKLQRSETSIFGRVCGFLSLQLSKLSLSFATRNHLTVDMPAVPPESTRGMKTLDRDAFKTKIEVPTVIVPVQQIGRFQKKVSKHLLKMHGIRPVAELTSDRPDRDNFKLFLFDPDKFKSQTDLSRAVQESLDDFGIDLSTWEIAEVDLAYPNWHYDDILRAILPANTDGVGGFSVIGHILHLNLKDELLPYKDIIGEVLLDKVSKVQTVVNKTNTIDNTYRNFAMEVLSGKDDFVTTAKSNGHSFRMDFSKVYWNPRLNTEHQRILDQLKQGDIVYDVFAGIGPFAVPAAKRKCIVLANDLNPESYKWLNVNMTENKVKSAPQMFNLDGREFIQTIIKVDLEKRWSQKEGVIDSPFHVVMNLPALAVEFLDAFVGLMADKDIKDFPNVRFPKVHCYTFSKADDPIADVKSCTETVLCSALPTNHTIRIVRNVAPRKEMLCVEFELPEEVLFNRQPGNGSASSDVEPPSKKCKTDS